MVLLELKDLIKRKLSSSRDVTLNHTFTYTDGVKEISIIENSYFKESE